MKKTIKDLQELKKLIHENTSYFITNMNPYEISIVRFRNSEIYYAIDIEGKENIDIINEINSILI